MENQRARWMLVGGDVLAAGIITLLGFATHGTAGTAGSRMLTTFLPVLVGWALAAPALGLYRLDLARDPRQLWRPLLAGVLVGPLAATLRAFLLQSNIIIPVFVAVLVGTVALGMTLWRAAWAFFFQRQVKHG